MDASMTPTPAIVTNNVTVKVSTDEERARVLDLRLDLGLMP